MGVVCWWCDGGVLIGWCNNNVYEVINVMVVKEM